MGLEATVVAGSAREDANIFVPGYSKDDAGKESALGTVRSPGSARMRPMPSPAP